MMRKLKGPVVVVVVGEKIVDNVQEVEVLNFEVDKLVENDVDVLVVVDNEGEVDLNVLVDVEIVNVRVGCC
jgi:hypothetical protein